MSKEMITLQRSEFIVKHSSLSDLFTAALQDGIFEHPTNQEKTPDPFSVLCRDWPATCEAKGSAPFEPNSLSILLLPSSQTNTPCLFAIASQVGL